MAADLARHFHAELHLLNVIPMFPTTTLPDLIPESEFLQETRTFAEGHLAKCQITLKAKGVKSTSSIEVGNDVAGNIMKVVERNHIDMVVISTHGISGCPRSTPPEVVERVERLRRERKTGVQIAQLTGISRATVSRILTRLKLNKIRMLEPKLPPNRYEHPCPGDLLHIDIKKLARIHKPGHRITGNPRTKRAAQVGSSSTSPPTTTPAWHMWL
jgi:hypothetical protein